jgi:ribosomal protein S1
MVVADQDFSRIVERSYPRWSRALGRVTQVRHYGVFLEFDDGMQGIIRRRDLAWDDTPRKTCWRCAAYRSCSDRR